MNAPWYSWGYGHVPAATFVAAWRHIVIAVPRRGRRQRHLAVDDPGRPAPAPGRSQSWWPGAQYVTWVGIDGYYYRRSDTFASVFGRTIDQVRAFTDKPVLLSETAVGPDAGQFVKIQDLFSGMASVQDARAGVVRQGPESGPLPSGLADRRRLGGRGRVPAGPLRADAGHLHSMSATQDPVSTDWSDRPAAGGPGGLPEISAGSAAVLDRVPPPAPAGLARPPQSGRGSRRPDGLTMRRPAGPARGSGHAVATAGRPGRAGGPVAAARMVQHGLSGRRPVPAGRATGVGPLAARDADSRLPRVLLRGAGSLPARGRARGQRRWPGRRADPVAVLHAGGHRPAVGHHGPAVRPAGRAPRRRTVRHPGRHAVPGRVRDLRRDGVVPAGPGRVAGRPVG